MLRTTEQKKHLEVKCDALLPRIPSKSPCHAVRTFSDGCWSSRAGNLSWGLHWHMRISGASASSLVLI